MSFLLIKKLSFNINLLPCTMEGQLKAFTQESSNLRKYHVSIWVSWPGRFWEKVNELLIRWIQVQPLKLFYNLALIIDFILWHFQWLSDGDLKRMWLKWRRYILADCTTEILCPGQTVSEGSKDCNLIYKLHFWRFVLANLWAGF